LFGEKKIATAVGQVKDINFKNTNAPDAKRGSMVTFDGTQGTVSSGGGDFTAQAVL
jgi:hypothetical protein